MNCISCLSEKRRKVYQLINDCIQLDRNADLWIRLPALLAALDELAPTTPRLLLTVFPPEKTYDGDKYQTKDYFSTMRAVEEFGIDRRLGKDAFEFLWDYMNPTTREFIVAVMSAMSDFRRAHGEQDLLEAFCDEQGIPTSQVHRYRRTRGDAEPDDR